MLTLSAIGAEIAARRKAQDLSQAALASKASIGHSTLDALENGRSGSSGFPRLPES